MSDDLAVNVATDTTPMVVDDDELALARQDSGIDYSDDEENREEEDEEPVATRSSIEEIVQDPVLDDAARAAKAVLAAEEEREFAAHRKDQEASIAALKASTESDSAEASLQPLVQGRGGGMSQRMSFLMAQSDVFTSFLMGGNSAVGNAMKKKSSKGKAPSTTETPGASNRHGKKKDDTDDNAAMLAMEESRFTRLTVQPKSIVFGTMRPFQLEGLNWLIRLHDCNINGILADEMGLGKTLQTISLLAYLKDARGIDGPHIIIVPKSTVGNWCRELKRWAPSIRHFRFMGDKHERAAIRDAHQGMHNADVVVVSYEIAIIEKSWLRKINWKYLIIDEAHRIKNEKSKLSAVVREFNVQHRMLITGTPLQNNLHELWALLNFLLPDVFTASEDFDSWFNVDGAEGTSNVIKKLHTVLRPFLLRRLKIDVAHGLPPKTETKLYVGISEMQRAWYTRLLQRDAINLNAIGGSNPTRLLNILMQLRKVCNHPYLFDGAEPSPFQEGSHLWDNCGKLTLLSKLLPRLYAQKSRVLIFCQMTRMMDILEDFLRYHSYVYCRLDGSTKGEDRDDMMERFNAPNSEEFAFLLSTRAGGLGINLATADIVILYDSDWNPQVDLQAMDRAHRIGQTKPVRVFRFISEGTVEEKIVERAERKLYLDAAVIQQGRVAEQNRKLSKDELMSMVKFGANEIFSAKGSSITDDDIDAILSHGEERTAAQKTKLQDDMQHSLKDFSLTGDTTSLYALEGESFEREGKKAGSALVESFIELPARERKKNYDVAEYYRSQQSVKPREKKEARAAKAPTLYDFQFYPDLESTSALMQKKLDLAFDKRERVKALKEAKADEARELKKRDKEDDVNETYLESLQSTIRSCEKALNGTKAYQLSSKEQSLLETSEAAAFGDFNPRDFKELVASLERHGRAAVETIVAELSVGLGKTVERLTDYLDCFWDRLKDLKDAHRLLERIERGEKRLERYSAITDALAYKVAAAGTDPLASMTLSYPSRAKDLGYTKEEDVYLIVLMHQYGYGHDWEVIKSAIRHAWQFRFDWFFKSRSVTDLSKRGEFLTRMIEKEHAETVSRKAAEEAALKVLASSGGGGSKKASKRKSVGSAGAAGKKTKQ